ncbi:putative dehydrogenase [Kribbella aluminosa]|uniref:Dehydrogenase n=1 Tax=Kribbella aluminosa TaxID=416017 RepID=A0ABS4UWY3_9ACTN|nr:putative dehydrogenase [Kribbella aluminosa]
MATRRPERCRVVAVAEPHEPARTAFASRHGLADEAVFISWQHLAAAPRLADAVVVAVVDDQHVDAALAFIERGYDILLEKPIATTADGCQVIAEAAAAAGVAVRICHVMRHTDYTCALKAELACENDGADHQVVAIEYDGGVTASFTLSAFTPLEHRRTRIFGTHGQLTGDGRFLEIFDFRSERRTVVDTSNDGSTQAEGHAGGDQRLVDDFVDRLLSGRRDLIMDQLPQTVDSHRVVFAAERARREGRIVTL